MKKRMLLPVLATMIFLTACGGGGGTPPAPTAQVAGTVETQSNPTPQPQTPAASRSESIDPVTGHRIITTTDGRSTTVVVDANTGVGTATVGSITPGVPGSSSSFSCQGFPEVLAERWQCHNGQYEALP